MSFIVFTVVLFIALWGWIAYEYQHAATISLEEEIELDEQLRRSSYTEVYDTESKV